MPILRAHYCESVSFARSRKTNTEHAVGGFRAKKSPARREGEGRATFGKAGEAETLHIHDSDRKGGISESNVREL